MTDKPVLIFKYTHAEAVANGELRILPVLRRQDSLCMPMFVGYQLDAQIKKHNITDDQLWDAIHAAFKDFSWKYSTGRRYTFRGLPVIFDLVPGAQLGDDDDNGIEEGDDILTLVLEGER